MSNNNATQWLTANSCQRSAALLCSVFFRIFLPSPRRSGETRSLNFLSSVPPCLCGESPPRFAFFRIFPPSPRRTGESRFLNFLSSVPPCLRGESPPCFAFFRIFPPRRPAKLESSQPGAAPCFIPSPLILLSVSPCLRGESSPRFGLFRIFPPRPSQTGQTATTREPDAPTADRRELIAVMYD